MKNLSLTLITLLLIACQPHKEVSSASNAAPASTLAKQATSLKADITVQGYTSTLQNIDIKFLGKTIPYTYSDGKIGNSRGYDWWVSKHFALKSDLPKEKVTLYLELLEMAYPHYVALFGMEPPNIERQRIAVVYGSSRARVREAMLDDGFLRGVHKTAGGETMFYNRAGYNFPSHREHHQRYIVIHETMHAFHMALNGHSTWAPNWITEGLADSVAHHVYDPKQKQLTVMVFDRAPMNYIETGLKQYYSANKPTIEQINDDPALKRGLNFFIIHYLLSSPERALYFASFIEQLRLANPHSEATLSTANSLLKKTFKDWQAVEQGFAEFVQNIKPSFHIVSGPWEQNGNAYWLRNTDSSERARLDINPANTATHPIMDFPAPAQHPLINLTDQNHVAALIEFEPSHIHRGEIGIALQKERSKHNQQYRTTFIGEEHANEDQFLALNVIDGEHILITASNIDEFATLQIALAPQIKHAIAKSGVLGLNIAIEQSMLKVSVKAENSKIVEQSFLVPLPTSLAANLDAKNISLLSKNNNHAITPYLFVENSIELSPSNSTQLTNPWLFENDSLLSRAFQTCQQHRSQLVNCDTELSDLLAKIPSRDHHSRVETELNFIMENYKKRLSNNGFKTLSGVNTHIYFNEQQAFLRVVNPSNSALSISAQVSFTNNDAGIISTQQIDQELPAGIHNLDLTYPKDADAIVIEQHLQWQSLHYSATLQQSTVPFNGVTLNITHTQSDTGSWLFNATLSGPYSGKTSGNLILSASSFTQATAVNSQQQTVKIAPYEHKNYRFELAPNDTLDLVTITALLDVDGEEIKLVKYINLTP
ncbi:MULTISPECIES: hypothetical protein [Pseudoalteromonas]|uniref:hypothetical protein n=1 Tax=Pseudoalteromonas TaxID=53246 RepID=UPI000306C588|nr:MULTISPECIES: hypothetical protein [Pseudoalteromonas]MCF6146510.1 hypothetical protein [Pseudoalteromonas mariniglutinosa NCIMB 1770]